MTSLNSPSCCKSVVSIMEQGLVTITQQPSGIWLLRTSPSSEIRVRFCPCCGAFWETTLSKSVISQGDQTIVGAIRKQLGNCSKTAALQFLVSRFGQMEPLDVGNDDTIYSSATALSSGVLCVRISRGIVAQVYAEGRD